MAKYSRYKTWFKSDLDGLIMFCIYIEFSWLFNVSTFSCSRLIKLKRYSKLLGMTPLSSWVKHSISPSAGPVKTNEHMQSDKNINTWYYSDCKTTEWDEQKYDYKKQIVW